MTAEYQAIFEANVKRAAEGGVGIDPTVRCIPSGLPRVMIAITPDATYFMLEQFRTLRRVYTDGRKFPDFF